MTSASYMNTQLCAAALGVLILSGCDSAGDWTLQSTSASDATASVAATATLGMSPPQFLTENRMLDQSQLMLDLTANGLTVPVTQNADGIFQGQLNFDANQSVEIVSAWSALVDSANGETLLPLASARRTVTVPDDPAGVIVPMPAQRFTTNFDSDGDTRSNIAELRAGTDATSGASPGTIPQRLPVVINFGIPASLQSADDATIAALSLSVLVNDLVFSVTRNGNVWSGEGAEVAGNDVFIDASFFSNSDRDTLLDRFELRQLMDENGVFLGLDTAGPTP